jgi:hypothetical protein
MTHLVEIRGLTNSLHRRAHLLLPSPGGGLQREGKKGLTVIAGPSN